MTTSPAPRGPSPLVRAMIVVSGSSMTAMAVGFIKNVLAAYYFGTSRAMDMYLVALLLPDIVMQLARTGTFNFIPLFRAEREASESEAWRTASRMLTYWLSLLTVLLLVAVVVAGWVMPLLAPGFGPDRRDETLELARVLFLIAASLGVGRILIVVLHAERRFLAAGLSEMAFQIGSTLFLIASHDIGIRALAWAQVLGGFLHLLVAASALLPERRRLRVSFDLRSAPVRKLIRLSLPVYLADSGDKLNHVVIRAFASLLPTGAVSSLQYAYFPIDGIHRMLAGPFVAAFFPFLSTRFARTDQRRARASLSRALVSSAVFFLPVTAGIWLLGDPMVIFMFERGRFDAGSTALTASALRLFAPALFALALNELLGSAFHARQDTLTPMRAGFVRVACNITLCAALVPFLGHDGIALAATISLYLKLLVLAWHARHVFTPAERTRTLRGLSRVGMAAGAALGVMYPFVAVAYPPVWITTHALRSLCGLGLLGAAVYVAALWLLARRQFMRHLGIVLRALHRRKRRAPPSRPPGSAARAALERPRAR